MQSVGPFVCPLCVLGQVTVISFVLGLVACVSSLLLLVLCMSARGEDFLARVSPHATLLPPHHVFSELSHWRVGVHAFARSRPCLVLRYAFDSACACFARRAGLPSHLLCVLCFPIASAPR
jgi:hypothetical protein